MKRLKTIAWLTAAFILCFFQGVSADEKKQELDGVSFKSRITVNNETLELKGLATLHYLVFIKAYTGALYLPKRVLPEDVLSDVPKRLELEYFHPIRGKDFYDATEKMIKKNSTRELFNRFNGELDRLGKAYKDVKPKDRYALTYWPGHGMDLSLNGIVLETFKNVEFAKAMFSIWLGDEPISDDFRDTLTGRK